MKSLIFFILVGIGVLLCILAISFGRPPTSRTRRNGEDAWMDAWKRPGGLLALLGLLILVITFIVEIAVKH